MIFDDFYAKKVIALDSACELGAVDGVYIDDNDFVFAGLCVTGKESFILDIADIAGKDNYITVCDKDALKPIEESLIKVSLGQKVLTRAGRELGTVRDIVIGRKYIKLMLEEESLAPYKISAASNDYLIVNLRAAKPTICADVTEDESKETELAYSEPDKDIFEDFHISSGDDATPKAQFEEFVVTAAAPLHYPSDSETTSAPDYSFLLGRKVEREISDLTRTFSIAVGTIITDKVLAHAKRAGKIVDLAINSSKL
ncbi:MAG: hypothetical protein PHI19_06890 [Clostridia bacterium]|nr:hypothetical protein [Clostridia bacterium]